jgi:chromosome transmission fidelity protein 18
MCLIIDLPEVVPEKTGVKRNIDKVEATKKIVERVKKDFFGRVIVELTEETQEGETKKRRTESSNPLKIQPDVWVRFHEGYSNAVRKPVAFMDLLNGKGL